MARQAKRQRKHRPARLPESPYHPAALPLLDEGMLSSERIACSLVELLFTDLGTIRLYERTLDRSSDAEARPILRCFHDQTLQHVEKIRGALAALSATEQMPNPRAEIQRERMERRLHLQAPSPLQEVLDLENLALSLTQSELIWEFLAEAIPLVEDRVAAKTLEELYQAIWPEKAAQADWIQETLLALRFRELVHLANQNAAA